MRLTPRIIAQCFCIIVLSGVFAFGVNALRPDGLPLAQAAAKPAPSAVKLSPVTGEIALKDAAMLFLSDRAVFLDARSAYEYQLGHIKGALSLPVRSFASDFQDIKPRLAGKDAVIAYCDGADCPLSHALAKHLVEAGVKNVYVLVNGWTLWQAEKLPVAQGTEAQGAPAKASAAVPAAKPVSAKAKDPAKAKDSDKGKAKLCTDCTN